MFVVRHYAEGHKGDYPQAGAIILLQMHMDNIMTLLETDDEAVKIRDQLIELLGKAGFIIRRWCSVLERVISRRSGGEC